MDHQVAGRGIPGGPGDLVPEGSLVHGQSAPRPGQLEREAGKEVLDPTLRSASPSGGLKAVMAVMAVTVDRRRQCLAQPRRGVLLEQRARTVRYGVHLPYVRGEEVQAERIPQLGREPPARVRQQCLHTREVGLLETEPVQEPLLLFRIQAEELESGPARRARALVLPCGDHTPPAALDEFDDGLDVRRHGGVDRRTVEYGRDLVEGVEQQGDPSLLEVLREAVREVRRDGGAAPRSGLRHDVPPQYIGIDLMGFRPEFAEVDVERQGPFRVAALGDLRQLRHGVLTQCHALARARAALEQD